MRLDVIEQYVEMKGHGELWVGQDDLPLRQVVQLRFPPTYLEQVEAEITTDFSAWGGAAAHQGNAPEAHPGMPLRGMASLDWRQISRAVSTFAIIGGLLILLVTSRSRLVYAGASLLVIASMFFTPLLQS